MPESSLSPGLVATPSSLGRLDNLPRARLGQSPTPLERMHNLEAYLADERGGPAPKLYVKRDDLTGLAMGGNKVRQLEYYVGEAVDQGADTLIITGAVQSNFVRLAAAAARTRGMDCHIQLEERVAKQDPLYRSSGNVLLDKVLGATLHSYPHGEDEAGADQQLEILAEDLRLKGKSPYVIHLAPGHPPLGALGYIDAAREVVHQMAAQDLTIDEMVVASGSGNTHAGFLFGLRALDNQSVVTGACVRRDAKAQAPRLVRRCQQIASHLDCTNPVADGEILLEDAFLAPGYGQLNAASREAIQLAAHCEALLLDPVYTAKTFAAFLQQARASDAERALLFLHSGGTPALFAYGDSLLDET
ncbi:D-cysteine desulfhydrase family protein [Rhodovibrionaceae bacterium A322]